MIQTTAPLTPKKPLAALSPLRTAPQPKETEVVKEPQDHGLSAPLQPGVPDEKAEVRSTGHKTATMAALAMGGLAVLSVAAPAQAAARTNLVGQVRTQPVFAGSAQDAVRQFSADRQIYVVGQPKYNGQNLDLKAFQEVFAKHPNAYIVLIGESDNVKRDDMAMSKGIANNPAFKGVVDPETGQPNGSLFMVYFKVTDQKFIQEIGKDRAIYMRSEQLLDDAGVGENDFVDRETREPRKLMQTYIQGVTSGQGPAAALGQVLDQMDAGQAAFVNSTVKGARATLDSTDKVLDQALDRVKDFQGQHGKKGSLGKPPVEAWKSQLQQAQDAFKARNYGQVGQLTSSLRASLASYQEQVAQFEKGPQQAQEIGRLIAELEQQAKDQASQTSLQQAKSSLARYQERYDANEGDFQGHLDGARSSATRAQEQIRSAESAAAAAKNLKIFGSGALGVGLLATTLVLGLRARKRGKESEKELDEAVARMGERSKELIAVLNQSDVQQVAAFTGTTQKLAKELMEDSADALTLLGGGEKVLAEARTLIKGDSFGSRLKNMFTTGNFDRAVALLTDPKEKIPFTIQDSQKTSMESGAAAWREYLLQMYSTKAGEESFLQMLDGLQRLTASNGKKTDVLLKETREVGAYLDGVRGQAEETSKASLELQKRGELFTAPSVSKRLMVAAEDKVAKGHEIKGTDPFRAHEEFGLVAERMIGDGNAIVSVGTYANDSTLPALNKADGALHPHEIQTDWAHSKAQEYSIQLDRTGEKAIDKSVKPEVDQLKQNLQSLEHQMAEVIALDDQRWNQSRPALQGAETRVTAARQSICEALHAAGVFQEGKPEQVLREADRDPSSRLLEARQNYEAVKPLLDEGNTSKPPGHLQAVSSLIGQSDGLVEDTQKALQAYPGDSSERIARREKIQGSIPGLYKPTLERIEAGYTPAARSSVVPEVSSLKVKTVADLLENTFQNLDKASAIQDQAKFNYERAQLLTARDQLAQIHTLLVHGQTNLDGIAQAEKLLGAHQASAEKEFGDLGQRIQGTDEHTRAVYVRRKAKDLLAQVKAELDKGQPVVFQRPASPYEAASTLAAVERLRTQVENTVNFDHQAYDAANAAIAQAKALIQSADADIDKASRTNWSQSISGYGQVSHAVNPNDLSQAKNMVGESRKQEAGSEQQLGPQEYEKSKTEAETSQATAQKAKAEVQRVVDAAHAIFQKKVATGESIADAQAQLDQASHELDSSARQSWSEYVGGYGQVSHSVDYGDLSRARSVLEEARSQIQAAHSAAQSDSFERAQEQARQSKSRAQDAIREARQVVEREHQVYLGLVREAHECVEAKELIGQAESAIRSAESEVSSAGSQSWSEYVNNYGTVSHSVSSSDLSSAHSYLSSARSDLSSANSYLSSRSYSSAQSSARSAISDAHRAESEAESVVSREHDEFRRMVRDAEEKAKPPDTGGGGGGGSTGGDGGTGGGPGGGGSGSTGGGW